MVLRCLLFGTLMAAAALGCSEKPKSLTERAPRAIAPDAPPSPLASAAPSKEVTKGHIDASVPSALRDASVAPPSPVTQSEWFVLDTLVDVGPAGPAAATRQGVILITRNDELHLGELTGGVNRSRRPQPTPVAETNVPAADLVALERGPAVLDGYVYYVKKQRLLRRRMGGGPLEILATDARDYTRVAVPEQRIPGWPAMAAYIARVGSEGALAAHLWVEDQGILNLTADGSASNSVSLARLGARLAAVMLESRTGMSPLHVAPMSLKNGKVELEPSRVVWVGGTAQPLTEVMSLGQGHDGWALLAIEQDATHFGLVTIPLTVETATDADVAWRTYPNGLEPAPVATGHACGRPVVVFAEPSGTEPHGPKVLHLASMGEEGLSAPFVLATSQGFADVSFTGLDGGALLVYVADHRTWARRLRCIEQSR